MIYNENNLHEKCSWIYNLFINSFQNWTFIDTMLSWSSCWATVALITLIAFWHTVHFLCIAARVSFFCLKSVFAFIINSHNASFLFFCRFIMSSCFFVLISDNSCCSFFSYSAFTAIEESTSLFAARSDLISSSRFSGSILSEMCSADLCNMWFFSSFSWHVHLTFSLNTCVWILFLLFIIYVKIYAIIIYLFRAPIDNFATCLTVVEYFKMKWWCIESTHRNLLYETPAMRISNTDTMTSYMCEI